MESNGPGVQPGMDVYDSNQDKIGTVASVNSTGSAGSAPGGTSAGTSGGGPGSLGNESAVGRTPSAGGGPGSLGDESAVGKTPSAGGPGNLGNESDVSGTTGTPSNKAGSGAGGTPGSGSAGTPGSNTSPDLVVETVEVDIVPDVTGASGLGAGQSGTIGGAPAGYEPNPYAGTQGYFTVTESAGLSGIFGASGKILDIPFSAIMNENPGQSVTLSVTKDDAERLYSRTSETPSRNS